MAAAFPLIKLASLVANQISQPLANMAKEKAKTNPFFRKYICIPPAQAYHFWEVKMSMWSKKVSGKTMNIPPLKESTAIDLGAGIVGDATVFLVGSLILLLEHFRRSSHKSIHDKEEAEQRTLMLSDLRALYIEKAKQEEKIRELCSVIDKYMGGIEFNLEPDIIANKALPEHLREHEGDQNEHSAYVAVEWLFTIINYITRFV